LSGRLTIPAIWARGVVEGSEVRSHYPACICGGGMVVLLWVE
jgi:hypothetical protein